MNNVDRSSSNSTEDNGEQPKIGWASTILISGVILLTGAGLTALVFWTQPGTSRGDRPEPPAMLVHTTVPDTGTFRPRIEAMGTVVASRDMVLRPRVGGEVIKRYRRFSSGGYVEKGDTMIKIDPSDFRNTVEQRRGDLREALSNLEIEQGQQDVAKEEFELLDREIPEENRDLVLRKPQLNSARASVRSARAALDQAHLDLKRTAVKAPFDAHVLSRNVSLGSQVSAGEELGRLVGLEKFWVDATVSLSKLRWLSVPDTPGDRGTRVRITDQSSWDPDEYRVGHVSKLIGELDGEARMARVRIGVTDPMARVITAMDSPPLVIGSYVRSIMKGRPIKNVVRIEREYVREDDTVWLMTDGELEVRDVSVVFRDRRHAYIREGLSGDEHVITSSLSTVVEGTKLRRENGESGDGSDSEPGPRASLDTDGERTL